jgi:hypothetical protein
MALINTVKKEARAKMRKTILVIGCLLLVIGVVAGCGHKAVDTDKPKIKDQISKSQRIEEKTEGFPQIMVGVWEAKVDEYSKWGIKFEPDGSMKKIIHSVAGPVNLEQGGVYAPSIEDPNKVMAFQMGPCNAVYDANTKMLTVTIIVDYYRMEFPQGVLEGNIKDVLAGPISEDGKTWRVKWWDYGRLEGAEVPDVNEITAHPDELTFYKIDLTKDPNSRNQ